MRDEQTSVNTILTQSHLCLSPFHCPPLFCAENMKVGGWKWPRGATEKALSWLMEVSWRVSWLLPIVPVLSLSLCLADHIRFYAELSWECSAKSVSISRPQSSSVWVRLLMIVQEMYFGQRQGDGGSQWCSRLRGLSCEPHTDTQSFWRNSSVLMQLFYFHWCCTAATFTKELKWFNGYTTL